MLESFKENTRVVLLKHNYNEIDITNYVKKVYPHFYKLAVRESQDSAHRGRPNYAAYNKGGYIGAWAIGIQYIKKFGYNFTFEQFKKDPSVFPAEDQLYCLLKMHEGYKRQSRYCYKFVGDTINGVKITREGIMYACHLSGPENVKKWFKNKGRHNPRDRNDVYLQDYLDLNSKKGVWNR